MRVTLPLVAVLAIVSGSGAHAKEAQPYAPGEAKLTKLLDGRVAGKPVTCIYLGDITETEVIDRTAIVYHVRGTLYVNRPQIAADALDSDDILVTKTFNSQLCHIDTIRLVSRAGMIERGFVGLGDFVPYARPTAK